MKSDIAHSHREIAEAIFRESAGLTLAFLEGHLDLVVQVAAAIAGACGLDERCWYSATAGARLTPSILRVSW